MYQKRALLFTSHLKVLAKCYNGRTFSTDIDETDNLALLSKKNIFPLHFIEIYSTYFFRNLYVPKLILQKASKRIF